ncbi:class I SAM-dependent methyltransferase [Pontibacillus litoralis]|uniref:DNA-methyltransferase n=1 Tax=Pontibacillus litoralis JSM 072002 TaxID=1385512 RepID=A0A0A5GAT4_9BACI|nr:class I SAM-dependent methyltransferase [Pontibacillus litoralis]KGX89124.1 DNA-methyltransferase [Pontibacillus litoralis JSM 072002]
MEASKTEQLYTWLDEVVTIISKDIDYPYIELLPLAGSILFEQAIPEQHSDGVRSALTDKLKVISLDEYTKEEIRKAIQLAILKAMKGYTQQQHYITPDSVAIFMGYLLEKVVPKKEGIRLFDPVTGTANLLTAVINQLDKPVEAYGSDVDRTLLELSLMNANLQQTEIELFHQDSLQPFLLEPVDSVIADLPVGYYPNDTQAEGYQLKAQSGHSYSHHLLIEQSVNYMKPGGYGLFLIPNFLFEGDQAEQLHVYLQQHTHIVGVLQLPDSMFKNERFGKSIFIVQKKAEHTKPPKEALIVSLPSFSNARAMNDIVIKINKWFNEYRAF